MPTALVLIDPLTEYVTFANKAAADVLGEEFPWNLSAAERLALLRCRDAEGQTTRDELNIATTAGRISVVVQAVLLPKMHGHASTIVMTIENITKLKESDETRRANGKCLEGRRILLIDDCADMRTLLQIFLSREGAHLEVASNSAEVIEVLDRGGIDLLVSDISMPGEDGFSLIRRIRARGPERNGNVPAIALTAYARQEERARVIEAGFDRHVSKPVESEKLLEAVLSLLTKAAN